MKSGRACGPGIIIISDYRPPLLRTPFGCYVLILCSLCVQETQQVLDQIEKNLAMCAKYHKRTGKK